MKPAPLSKSWALKNTLTKFYVSCFSFAAKILFKLPPIFRVPIAIADFWFPFIAVIKVPLLDWENAKFFLRFLGVAYSNLFTSYPWDPKDYLMPEY